MHGLVHAPPYVCTALCVNRQIPRTPPPRTSSPYPPPRTPLYLPPVPPPYPPPRTSPPYPPHVPPPYLPPPTPPVPPPYLRGRGGASCRIWSVVCPFVLFREGESAIRYVGSRSEKLPIFMVAARFRGSKRVSSSMVIYQRGGGGGNREAPPLHTAGGPGPASRP